MKAASSIFGLIASIVVGWLFMESHFMPRAQAEERFEQQEQSMLFIQLDTAEERLYRLQKQDSGAPEDKAREEQLKRSIRRLEGQIAPRGYGETTD